MKAIISKDAEISHEPQVLDHVMAQYRSKRSNGSNSDEKLLKNESGITEEQWFNIITPLDLRQCYISYISFFGSSYFLLTIFLFSSCDIYERIPQKYNASSSRKESFRKSGNYYR